MNSKVDKGEVKLRINIQNEGKNEENEGQGLKVSFKNENWARNKMRETKSYNIKRKKQFKCFKE